jgi:hypothetical protein
VVIGQFGSQLILATVLAPVLIPGEKIGAGKLYSSMLRLDSYVVLKLDDRRHLEAQRNASNLTFIHLYYIHFALKVHSDGAFP